MLYNIIHCYDVDGGFGDAIPTEDVIATVESTEEDIQKWLERFDHPEVYDSPYADLYEHNYRAVPIEVVSIKDVTPYMDDILIKKAFEYLDNHEGKSKIHDLATYLNIDESLIINETSFAKPLYRPCSDNIHFEFCEYYDDDIYENMCETREIKKMEAVK